MNIFSPKNKVTSVIRAIYQITAYQTIQRVHHTHDLYAVEDNGKYVQLWAISQIIIMLICSILQVYIIRHLFKSNNPKKSSNSVRFVPDSRWFLSRVFRDMICLTKVKVFGNVRFFADNDNNDDLLKCGYQRIWSKFVFVAFDYCMPNARIHHRIVMLS